MTWPCPILNTNHRAWLFLVLCFFVIPGFCFGQSQQKIVQQDAQELEIIRSLILGDNPQSGFDSLNTFVNKYILRDSFDTFIPALAIGILEAFRLKRFGTAEALYHWADSLMVLEQSSGHTNWSIYNIHLSTAYAKVLHATGNLEAAIAMYQQLIQEINSKPNPSEAETLLLINNENWYIKVLKEAGRWPEAMRYYDRIIASQAGSHRPDIILNTRVNRAGALSELGFPDSARIELLSIIDEYRTQSKKLLIFIDKHTLNNRLCNGLTNLAESYLALHRYDEALAVMQTLHHQRSTLAEEPDFGDLYFEAKVLHAMGRFEEALQKASTSYSLYQHQSSHTSYKVEFLLDINLLISEILRSLLAFEDAIRQLDTLEKILNTQIGNPFNDLLSSSGLMPFIQIYYERSKISEQRFRAEKDTSILHELGKNCASATNLLHQLQSRLPDSETLIFLNNYGRKINMIGLAYAEYVGIDETLNEAIFYGESGKTILLDLAVRQQTSSIDPNVPKVLQEHEMILRSEIAGIYANMKKSKGEEKSRLQKQLAQRQNDREQLMETLKEDYPDFYHQRFERLFPDAALLRKSLPSNAAILTFTWQDTVIYGLVLTDKYEKLRRIIVPDSLTAIIKNYRFLITDKSARDAIWGSSQSKEFVHQARYLYQLLIQPFEDLLPERVLLIPDGVLAYLPFDCLLTRDPKPDEAWSTLPYFIRKHALSIHFSLSTWQRLEVAPKQQYSLDYIGFAPDFNSGFQIENTPPRDILVPLLHNKEEVEKGMKLFGGQAWYGKTASLNNFRKIAKEARIIHLATHGKANSRIGDESFIAFANTGISTEDNPADSLLVRDLYMGKIPAALVILSACETGIGEVMAGEGIIGLNNGFVHAGVRSLLSTLWSVDDLAMSRLIGIYLEEIKNGSSKDLALQRAKLSLLDDPAKAHPYFWSASIQQGSLEPLYPARWIYWAGGFAFIFVLALALFYFRKRWA